MQGDYEKAIGYYQQALATLENKLGPEHPTTITARKNLKQALADTEQNQSAVSLSD